MAERQRLVAALMLAVAAAEQVMIEAESEPHLTTLYTVARELRDVASTAILSCGTSAAPSE